MDRPIEAPDSLDPRTPAFVQAILDEIREAFWGDGTGSEDQSCREANRTKGNEAIASLTVAQLVILLNHYRRQQRQWEGVDPTFPLVAEFLLEHGL